MSNTFYNFTSGTPVAISRGTSALLRSEFTLIGQGFDSVLTRFAATDTTASGKGAIAGQVWTGTHDFTGGAIKVPTLAYGASGKDAASIDYVNTAVVNAVTNLPGQAGRAGKVLTTNGTITSWGDALNIAPAAGGTLTAAHWLFTQSASYTLPDISTATGLALTSATNAATLPVSVTTSDGWTVATGFSIGTTKTIASLTNTTPHGWWGGLLMTPKQLAQTALAGSSVTVQSSVQLSPTCVVFAFVTSSRISLVAADPTTGNVGNVVTLNSSTAQGELDLTCLFPLGATGFTLVFNGTSNGSATAYAGSVSGLTISGASTVVSSSGLADTAVQCGAGNTFLVALVDDTALADLLAFSVSGTTVTAGTPIASGAKVSSQTRIMPISTTAALVVYANSSSSNTTHSARVVTVSGLTLSRGAAATTGISTLGSSSIPNNLIVSFSGTSFLYLARDATAPGNVNLIPISVSGTTTTIGAAVVLTASMPNGNSGRNLNLVYTGRGVSSVANGRWSVVLDASRILMLDADSKLRVVSISGNVLTAGPTIAATAPALLIGNFADPAGVYLTQATGGTQFQKVTVAGTTVTLGTAVAAWPSSIFSDTLNDSAVNYGGTWYKWAAVPAATAPLAADKYINLSGATLTVYGSFA